MAAEYGLTLAFLNSNKELKGLFDRAVKNTWDPTRFQAAVRNTNWYKRTAEPYRQAQVLKKTDPATYGQRLNQVRARLRLLATEYGASIGGKEFGNLAERVFQMGLDDNQVRRELGEYVKYSDGRMLGQAGQWEAEMRQHMQDMGISWGNKAVKSAVTRMVTGSTTIQDALSRMNEQAKSKYAHLASRIDAGETVYEIASPYIQEIGEILEQNPESVTLKNPLIQKALDVRGEKDTHRTMTISEFGDQLRQTTKWRTTDNAKAAASTTVRQLGQFFGQAV
jgi:hypothetical protein